MTLNLLSAVAVRENVIRLQFDAPVYYTRVLDSGDAYDVARYIIVGDPDSRDQDGEPPRALLPAQADLTEPDVIDLWLDRKMSGFPARYSVDVNGLLTALTLEPLGEHTAFFFGVLAALPPPTTDAGVSNRDLANPQDQGAPGALGSYATDDTGDVAFDSGLVSYRKRVLRRLSTRKGAYKHLPNYGVNVYESVKALARPGLIEQLASDAQDQVKQEPETVQAKVDVIMQGPIAYFRVRARCTFGGVVEITAPVLISG